MRDWLRPVLASAALLILLVLGAMIIFLTYKSVPVLSREGLSFILDSGWVASEGGEEYYGIAAALLGTLYTSAIAVALALPVSVSLSVFVVEMAPRKIRTVLEGAILMMALLPTVLYGLWGLTYLGPFLLRYIMCPLHGALGWFPLFSEEPRTGNTILTAGVLLAIMITPYMTAIIKDAYSSIPREYREGLYALGTTRAEAIFVLLKMVRSSIAVAVVLGLGRAAGETVAVSMVVGNTMGISISPFRPGYTISSLIANQFGNAFLYRLMPSALYGSALILMGISTAIAVLGLWLARRWSIKWRI